MSIPPKSTHQRKNPILCHYSITFIWNITIRQHISPFSTLLPNHSPPSMKITCSNPTTTVKPYSILQSLNSTHSLNSTTSCLPISFILFVHIYHLLKTSTLSFSLHFTSNPHYQDILIAIIIRNSTQSLGMIITPITTHSLDSNSIQVLHFSSSQEAHTTYPFP